MKDSEFRKVYEHASCYEERKDVWIAALEWVLEIIKTCEDEDSLGYLREDILTDDIKRELERLDDQEGNKTI